MKCMNMQKKKSSIFTLCKRFNIIIYYIYIYLLFMSTRFNPFNPSSSTDLNNYD